MGQPQLLQGNEACAEGAIAAGARFFAGYPITPSTEIAEHLSLRLPEVGGTFIQMEDEIASIAAVIGASLAGTKALTATSGPGFSLMQENIGYAVMAEVPCVIIDVQRAGPSTGGPTEPGQGDLMQARWGTHGSHPIITLAPSSVQECFDLTVTAFNLAERYRVPVIVLSDAVVAHVREKVIIPPYGQVEVVNRKKPTVPPGEFIPYEVEEAGVPPMANFGDGYRVRVTGLSHDDFGFPTNKPKAVESLVERLLNKVWFHQDEITFIETENLEDAHIALVAFGSVARSARAAMKIARSKGLKIGLIRPITVWPFPHKFFSRLTSQIDLFVVAELNLGQLVNEIDRATCGRTKSLRRVDGHLITPEEIWDEIKGAI